VPDLTTDQLTLALTVVGGVALIAFLFVLILALRVRKLRREYAIVRGDGAEKDVVAATGRALRQIEAIDRRVDGVVKSQERQAEIGRLAMQKFGIVRYDAFEEMGGRLSFSAAFLDDHGDGVVFTSINGRTETRTYAKPIKELSSDFNLSDEERAAIAGAMAAAPERSEPRAPVSR
jgi:uncharacterized protein DUF4446